MTRHPLTFAVIGLLCLPCDGFSFVAPLRARASLVENGHAREVTASIRRNRARCRMEVMEVELERVMDNVSAKRLDLVDKVPPHLVLETKRFVVEEVMNEGISTALQAYGLEGADGEGTNADILTDIDELSMNFKPGRTMTFACMIRAKEITTDAQEEASAAEPESSGNEATSADTLATGLPVSEGGR